MTLAARVADTIRRRGLLEGGERVLVAVSGGADSVALLHVLHDLRAAFDLTLEAGHVHHGLRPEADGDAALVAALCRDLGVPLAVERVSVARRAAAGEDAWGGLEAEARRVRYQALTRMSRAAGAGRLATAHTADDQAETVLMRLLQGAGPRGLAAIPARRAAIIRPLIDVRRSEVEAYLGARGIRFARDPMNLDLRFLRSRIRHELLPFLVARFEPELVAHLARSADLVRTLVEDLETRAGAALQALARPTAAGLVFPVSGLISLPAAVAAEVVALAVRGQGAPQALRGNAHGAIARLLAPGARAGRERLGRAEVERSGPWLRVGSSRLPPVGPRDWPVPGAIDLPEVSARLESRVFPREPGYVPPDGRRAVAFDSAALPGILRVRARRPGDCLVPFGASSARRLKALLIDAGVPRWERDRLPLLEAAGEIAWVVGLRRGRAAPVTAHTRSILEVTVHGSVASVTSEG